LSAFTVIILATSVIVQNEALADSGIPFKIISSPLAQFKSGTPVDKIICLQDFTLVIKTEDDYPACVKSQTVYQTIQQSQVG
jgi:hypothetical protein